MAFGWIFLLCSGVTSNFQCIKYIACVLTMVTWTHGYGLDSILIWSTEWKVVHGHLQVGMDTISSMQFLAAQPRFQNRLRALCFYV